VLTAAIFQTGGLVFYPGAIRVSLTSTHRTLVALVVLLIYRFARAPRIGPFGRCTAAWQRLLDTIEHEPLVVRAGAGAWMRGGLAALGIAAALAALLHEQLRHLDSVPDLGDPLFSIWRVAWVAHQIVADPWHLFDANIFYPEHLTLTLSDPVLLPAMSVSPLLALGVHPTVVYNLLLMSGFWLSGVATYLLVERLTGSARGAFIVSSSMRDGRIEYVGIESQAGGECALRNPFEGGVAVYRGGAKAEVLNGELLRIPTSRGEKITLVKNV